ncbi:MAG: 4Fe-4S dicluster domain-containing protein, partial [Deferrisomatales bacterium]|nr:4Fe-4S dicluster domain-containing protein [Deferrisomatales bacterium]
MKTGLLQTNGDALAAVEALLKGFLERGVVDEVLVPARVPSGGTQLSLFADAELMQGVNPWAPVMPVQGARAVSNLAFTDPGRRVAAVLRPCEARAVIELIKLKQIKPEQLTFITVDCPGTYELTSFAESGVDAAEVSKGLLGGMQSGTPAATDGLAFRTACSICEFPSAEWGALRIQVFGADAGNALGLQAEDAFAAALAAADLATFDESTVDGRAGVVKSLCSERVAARDALLAQFQGDAGGLDGLRKAFSTCIRCYNCMENCPICYCKLCIFKSPTFDHPGEMYTRWAQRKGAQPMLAETTLFHLTRLNHMSTSCIGCGLCDTACPMGLPVASLFRSAAQGVQGMLEYQPGRSLDDPIPLTVFREDELQAEAGAKD